MVAASWAPGDRERLPSLAVQGLLLVIGRAQAPVAANDKLAILARSDRLAVQVLSMHHVVVGCPLAHYPGPSFLRGLDHGRKLDLLPLGRRRGVVPADYGEVTPALVVRIVLRHVSYVAGPLNYYFPRI